MLKIKRDINQQKTVDPPFCKISLTGSFESRLRDKTQVSENSNSINQAVNGLQMILTCIKGPLKMILCEPSPNL